ncbi:MAG: hypothetical protein L0H64_18090, partial [Pseudonocardia sp.]|nr:hypothetical protein [Pseudonocardia sp.]
MTAPRPGTAPGLRDDTGSFGAYLATLDAARLTALLERRPDLLVEPVPRSVDELALRLQGFDSLTRVLPTLDHDAVAVLRAVALIPSSPVAGLAARIRSPVGSVGEVVDALCGGGLAWLDDGRVALPPRVAEQFACVSTGLRPLHTVLLQVRVEDLRDAITGLGGDPARLLKPALERCYGELVGDPAVVGRAVASLPPAAGELLHALSRAGGYHSLIGARAPATQRLAEAGLLLPVAYGVELPPAVAVQVLAASLEPVTGQPPVAPARDARADGRAEADAALLALTTLLDESRARPVAALKKGGVGTRERARLTKTLKITEPALWIDLAHAAGLLAHGEAGFAATDAYDAWRDGGTATRWADVVSAWFALDLAPSSRETDDGEVAPPLPLHSGAGLLRRALLRAAAGGGSLLAATAEIDWFCPWPGYDAAGTTRKAAAARLAEPLHAALD